MPLPGRSLLIGGLTLLVFALDQFTKWLVVSGLYVGESTQVIGSLLRITRRVNTGGAFGVLQGSTPMLAVVSAAVVLALLIWGPRLAGRSRVCLVGLGLITGGALGNVVDRVRLGHVVDFIHVPFWPVFNVADIGITVGVGLVLLMVILEGRGHHPAASA